MLPLRFATFHQPAIACTETELMYGLLLMYQRQSLHTLSDNYDVSHFLPNRR